MNERVDLRFGWAPAFRIAIAIVVVQAIAAVAGFMIAIAIGVAAFRGL